MRVYNRNERNRSTSKLPSVDVTVKCHASLSGSTRFGITPGGGCPMGILLKSGGSDDQDIMTAEYRSGWSQ